MSTLFDVLSREDQRQCIEYLSGVKKLIAKSENWTKELLARDQEGEYCDVLSENAHSFSLVGAMIRNHGNLFPIHVFPASELIRTFIENRFNKPPFESTFDIIEHGINAFNDHHLTKHSDITNLLNMAIRKLVRRYRQLNGSGNAQN